MIRLKLTVLIVFVLLSVLVSNGWGATYTWDHSGTDRLWKTAANWSTDIVPTSADNAQIDTSGANKPIIDSTHTGASQATCANAYLGYGLGATGELSMTGGLLNVASSYVVPGYSGTGTITISGGTLDASAANGIVVGWYSGSTGTLTISGGSVNANKAAGSGIRCGYKGSGTINMTGGSVLALKMTVPYDVNGMGRLHLDGGIIELTSGTFSIGDNGIVDINGGTLIISGDVTSTITTYIGAGKLKGYGGSGTINASYNTPYSGKTTVTAAIDANVIVLENTAYKVTHNPDFTFVVKEKSTGVSAAFTPTFTIFKNASSPGKNTTTAAEKSSYPVLAWNSNANLFDAPGTQTTITPTSYSLSSGKINWIFPSQSGYSLAANIEVLSGTELPKISYTLSSTSSNYYSVGYTGTPEELAADVNWIWQPMIWQSLRFPENSYLTQESLCSIPAVLIGKSGTAIGVAADANEQPFRMPTTANSRFGVIVRNGSGNAQPMLFAPIYGGTNSQITNGNSFSFSLRLFVKQGDCYSSFKQLATGLYKFSDYRQNSLCSLNTTLEQPGGFYNEYHRK